MRQKCLTRQEPTEPSITENGESETRGKAPNTSGDTGNGDHSEILLRRLQMRRKPRKTVTDHLELF